MIQGAFDRSTAGSSLWVGESGVLTATVLILFAIVLYKLWPIRQPISSSKSRLYEQHGTNSKPYGLGAG